MGYPLFFYERRTMDGYTSNREPYMGIGPIENRNKEIPNPIAFDKWIETKDGKATEIHVHDGSTWNTF